jgi:hypothetical protein
VETARAWGHLLEFGGLLLVLLATWWQLMFTEWFDWAAAEGRAVQQEQAELAILHALPLVADACTAEDPTVRVKIQETLYRTAGDGVTRAIGERESRLRLHKEQAEVFGWIRSGLLLLGAVAMVLGKWLEIRNALTQGGTAKVEAGS